MVRTYRELMNSIDQTRSREFWRKPRRGLHVIKIKERFSGAEGEL